MPEAHTENRHNSANQNIEFLPYRLDVYYARTLRVLFHELRQTL